MPEFEIMLSEFSPNSKEDILEKVRAAAQETDFFDAAAYYFSGIVRVSDDEKFVEFPVQSIVGHFVGLLGNTFAINFSSDYLITPSRVSMRQLPVNNIDFGKPVNFSFEIVEDKMHLEVDFHYDGIFTSNVEPEGGKTFNFVVPLAMFNRAVGKAYDQAIDFLEDMFLNIDGFEDRFCTIPYRRALRDY